MIYSLLILSVSLSLDSLGAGLSYGLRKIRIPFGAKALICICSILYALLAILAGGWLHRVLSPSAAKIVGVIILAYMGLAILWKALRPPKKAVTSPETKTFRITLRSLEITIRLLRNPSDCDVDHSGIIDLREAILLGLALSIDALGVGVGAAMTGLKSLLLPFSIGLCQYLFLCIGLYFGTHASKIVRSEKLISALPGILLLAMAVLRAL